MSTLAEGQDAFTMRCCRYLIRAGEKGLPKGETAETFGELIEVHRAALHLMKQRKGKGVLVLELGQLAKKWPSDLNGGKPPNGGFDAEAARQEPLMREAKEIFNGTWLDADGKPIPDKPEVMLL